MQRTEQQGRKPQRSPYSATRSKSNTTLTFMKYKLSNHLQQEQTEKQPNLIRIKSAVKKGQKRYSKQKLWLGSMSRPQLLASHDVRHNPWRQHQPIQEHIIAQKGLLDVINMGLLPKTTNFTDLLNHRYQLVHQYRPETPSSDNFFPTNPNLQLVHDSAHQSQTPDISEKSSGKLKKKPRKINPMKKKTSSHAIIIPEERIILQIINQHIVKNDQYFAYFRKIRMDGYDEAFRCLIKSVEKFAFKYRLKKFDFYPFIQETKKINDQMIYNHIINGKIVGIYKSMQGNKQTQQKNIFRMLLNRFLYKKALKDLERVEDIKRFFRVKKYYEQMMIRRTEYLKFKFSAFVHSQEAFISKDETTIPVEVHILTDSSYCYQIEQTYYKLNQRNNIQLTRLFSTQPEHLLVLVNKDINIVPWRRLISKIAGYHPQIEILQASLGSNNVRQIDDIYYGLRREVVEYIKKKCKNRTSMLVGGSLCNTLVKICDCLGTNLLGGNFIPLHKEKLLDQAISEDQLLSHEDKHFIQRKKLKKIDKYQLTNQYLNNKVNIKHLFHDLVGKSLPTLFFDPGMDEEKFFYTLSELIISEKNINKWVFKLKYERFSRGLGFLETDSIKILKQKKKKASITSQDIDDIYHYIQMIILDKLFLPQDSLHDRKEFMDRFFKEGGYVEAVCDDVVSLAVYGRIQWDGNFQQLGSYRKIYTNQEVNCGAIYPAPPLPRSVKDKIRFICEQTHKRYSICTYITIEILYDRVKREYHYIDMIPHLDQYSCMNFVYSAYTKKEDLRISARSEEFEGKQKRWMLYLPFIDNNGNRFQSFKQFEDALLQHKLTLNLQYCEGVEFLYLNLEEQLPDCLSMIVFGDGVRSVLKHCLDGLNFLLKVGDKVNKFDKRIKRPQKTDALCLQDIVWKLREFKKSLDHQH